MEINIIKLGGSIVTCERGAGLFDRRNTLRLAREIAPHARGLILIHGTGLVGKPPAVKHGYARDGHLGAARRLLALGIRHDLRGLNHRFIEIFLEAGVPVTPMSVEHCFDERMARLRSARVKEDLLNCLAAGQVPVFHGDLMPQRDGGFQVLSSDVIARILAGALRPSRCIFLTDVPGVFIKGLRGAILKTLDSTVLHHVARPRAVKKDVSGSMGAKIECARAIARCCGQCLIASGRARAIVPGLFAGADVPATRVLPF